MSKPYCGVSNIPKGHKRGTMKECAQIGQVRYYGLKKIDPRTLEHAKKSRGESKRNLIIQRAKLRGKLNLLKRKHGAEKDSNKKKKINEEYKKVVVEFKMINNKIKIYESKEANARKRSKSSSRKSRESSTGKSLKRKKSRSSRK